MQRIHELMRCCRFLDEPTSGLDEVTAASCIRLLSRLAHEDRTIICTIHQPSAKMFEQFDDIYLLAQGQCVYQGSPKMLLPFLTTEQFTCPKYNNPADYSKYSLITSLNKRSLARLPHLQLLNSVISNRKPLFHDSPKSSRMENNNASQFYQMNLNLLKPLY